MESAELRENILDQDFSQVGIGVACREGKGYYITLDFRQSLKVLNVEGLEQEINSRIREKKLLPLKWDKRLSREAKKMSELIAKILVYGLRML